MVFEEDGSPRKIKVHCATARGSQHFPATEESTKFVGIVLGVTEEMHPNFLNDRSIDPRDEVPEVDTLTPILKFSERGEDDAGRQGWRISLSSRGIGVEERTEVELEGLELGRRRKSNGEILGREVSVACDF